MNIKQGTIIAISNQKGGCGKTTTAIQLAAGLCARKNKVLLVDADPQASLTKANRIRVSRETLTAYEFILDKSDARIQLNEHLDIIPAAQKLDKLSSELVNEADGILYLRYALEEIRYEYDHIIIDCPPQASLLSNNCYGAADEIIIPVFPGTYSVDGMVILKRQLDSIKRFFNPDLQVVGILITNADTGTKASIRIKELADQCSEKFDSHCFEAVIPHATAVNDAQNAYKSLLEFNKHAKVTKAYEAFVDEYLKEGRTC